MKTLKEIKKVIKCSLNSNLKIEDYKGLGDAFIFWADFHDWAKEQGKKLKHLIKVEKIKLKEFLDKDNGKVTEGLVESVKKNREGYIDYLRGRLYQVMEMFELIEADLQ